MKKTAIIFFGLLVAGSISVSATRKVQPVAETAPGVSVDRCTIEHNGKYLTVEMSLDLSTLNVESNRAVLLTPRLVNGSDSLDLPSVGIYGRRRYYYYMRNGEGSITGPTEIVMKASEKPDNLDYLRSVDYAEWMDGATLTLNRSDRGCCRKILATETESLGRHFEAFFPELVFVRPQADTVKSRSLSGSAFIDFPVNKTEIYPDYRRNTSELGKIEATIDSVRQDRDVTIETVLLKGYASPESPYAHNRELAKGRTASLKRHIQSLYDFADGVIITDYEPEDWAGLRRYVESSNLEHRAEILDLIDSELEPDAKEARIKRSYPDDYRFLLQYCYPALRHTDYRIDYNIRSYSDADEIERIMKERPQNLSLNELYLVSGRHEPGTVGFTEVFETAVRMYPDDETANLNAANAAIRRDDYQAAQKYLDKAGTSAEALYARGALAIRRKDYTTAVTYLEKARAMGLAKAADTLSQMSSRGYTE